MKLFSLIIVFSLTIGFSKAQTFTLNPGNLDSVYAAPNQLTIFDIYPVNITSGDIIFSWTRISVNVPPGWDYSLCDYGNCYTGIPNNGTMDTVSAGNQGLLGLNINPYVVGGQGEVKLYVYDSNFPNDGDTVTWVVNASFVSVDEIPKNIFSFYPNPVNDQLTIYSDEINAGMSYAIYSMSGEIVLTETLSNDKNINTSNLPAGIYLLQISGDEKSFAVKFIHD